MKYALYGLLAVVVLAAARGGTDGDATEEFAGSWVATANGGEIPVYPMRGATEPSMRLPSPLPSGSAQVFLVEGKEVDPDWLLVHLPIRPNGSMGWVRTDDVTVTRNDYRIAIDLDDHELSLSERGDELWTTEIGVGTSETPTPGGSYYIKELLESTEPDGLYGPFAYGLSGFSDSPGAADFNGGEGVLGIHGTNDPETLGEDVSHGCIRVSNEVISHLASTLPMGTPVDIS